MTTHLADRVKILIVDNLKDNLLALEWLLKREDVDIFKALSGIEALELMVAHQFALALVDVQMPDMSGFELAELMRGANRTKSIPIIFVTATASDQSFSFKGYESGAVDFLLKPLDTHAVKNKVNIFIELYRQRMELALQLEMITANQEVQERLLLKLRNTQVELERAVRVRDEFMSIASHELKNPLTAMKLQIQLRSRLATRGDVANFTLPKLIHFFKADEVQVDRITYIIDDMLDITRISSGKFSITIEQLDLAELVLDLVERNMGLVSAAGCTTEIDVSGPVIGNWDRFRIEQVVMNLLTNAIRFGAGGVISVKVSSTANTASIVVRDFGRGIARENHERIFKKFERAVSVRDISGLGLGLYIVKELLEAHHGTIRVESDLGKGATFFVELPRAS